MIKGLIFDIDGTLVSLKVDAITLRKTMIEHLTKRGYDTSALDPNSNSQAILDHALAQIDSGLVKEERAALLASMYSVLDELELGWNKDSLLLEDTVETLRKLRESSLKLAVVTNSGRVSADFLLGKYDLSSYFDLVLTRDDVEVMKPKPNGILKALELLGVKKDEVLYVGDSWIDIKAARLAGVKVASVATGHYTAERLQTEGTDYLLVSISGVLELLG